MPFSLYICCHIYFLFLSLSLCLFLFSLLLSLYFSFSSPFLSVHLSIYQSGCLCIYLSIYLHIYQSIYPSITLSFYSFHCLYQVKTYLFGFFPTDTRPLNPETDLSLIFPPTLLLFATSSGLVTCERTLSHHGFGQLIKWLQFGRCCLGGVRSF